MAKTGAVMLYESDIILIIVEALNGTGPHPMRAEMESADILDELQFPDDVRAALKGAAREIIQYFAKQAHAAGVSPENYALLVKEGNA